ncbi:hypothetical protein [Wenxinia saemankumensis]|uniref:Anti-sigma factor NepR domain-containing protein n=1 Tax=Wenxinia saemankumensis TaxID=1447782 RepID=A0A1M6HG53_9RHOB|nr:hypothetical protein [Wenxinia saemankumensis]SHJ21206.1 hypothetical protein SAMN05444417_3215 [Wenxinia saemankumensis]
MFFQDETDDDPTLHVRDCLRRVYEDTAPAAEDERFRSLIARLREAERQARH